MSAPILATKLYIPPPRPKIVLRPRLIERLTEGLSANRKLTLISAPAGFGKTTLVSEWISCCDQKVAWLSLDEGDNDPARFLTYLISALQTITANVGEGVLSMLQSPQLPKTEFLLTELLNEISTIPTNFVLVLDDYHVIDSKPVDNALTFLLDHLPPQMHLVITTREDPSLPLPRYRARGQLAELRAADLRFTPAEAADFLNQVMGLNLAVEDIAALEARTEGWIVGLQLAALSMQGHQDTASFIKSFTGSHHFVLDYLVEEVLEHQSEHIRSFLLQTAILDRLCAPLCNAVTEREDGKEMLDVLERSNLFLIPLDDKRQWYRYNHLFADLLRTQQQKSLEDQGIARLHLRASEWYEQNDMPMEAIHHASLASDFERIERLIEQNYIKMMNQGEMVRIRFWMGKLSKEMVYRRPWLCLYEALSRSWFGQLEEANFLLNMAEKHIQSKVSAPDTQAMLGYHAYVKSRVTAMQGNTRRAIELCLTARENTPASNLGMQIEIGITLGYEYFLYGDFIKASKTLHDMILSCYTVSAINNPVAGYALLARMYVHQGLLHDAHNLYEKAAQLIQETDGQYLGAIGLVDVGKAALLYEWNDLGEALVRIKQSLDFLPFWGKTDDLCLAYTTLARIQLAQVNLTEAANTLEKAAQLIQTCGVFSEARSSVETAQVKLWLVQGDWLAIDRWVAPLEKRLGSHHSFGYEDELTHITRARVLIAQNKLDEAIGLLNCLEEFTHSSGRQGRLIEIMILKALALKGVGSNTQAELALTESLILAEPEGYIRIFIDEGPPMENLLNNIKTDNKNINNYIQRLKAAFLGEKPTLSGTNQQSLIEPLSERELEVLRLLRSELSGPEIARDRMVSLSTVRTHIQHIFAKLGVNNRRAAVRRAEELDLL